MTKQQTSNKYIKIKYLCWMFIMLFLHSCLQLSICAQPIKVKFPAVYSTLCVFGVLSDCAVNYVKALVVFCVLCTCLNNS